MPFFAETVFDVIHRSADEFPVGVFLVIENSQCYLGKFRTHAEQGGNPHPEHGAGSADSDSAGNTGNITGTNRGGKCCTDRLKGVIAPSEASRLRNILPSVVRIAYGNFRIWKKRVRRLR